MTASATQPNPGVAGLTGAAGGFLSGILGGGGGAIMVPLMTGPLRMRQHTAHGTSLVVIVVTALVADCVTWVTLKARWAINWPLGFWSK